MRRFLIALGTIMMIALPLGLAAEETHTYYLPYFINDNGQWTAVGLRNNSDTTNADVDVTIYDKFGQVVATEKTAIPPRRQDNFVVGTSTKTNGWIKIESDQEISGLCFLASATGLDYMANIPFVTDLAYLLYIPHAHLGPVYNNSVLI